LFSCFFKYKSNQIKDSLKIGNKSISHFFDKNVNSVDDDKESFLNNDHIRNENHNEAVKKSEEKNTYNQEIIFRKRITKIKELCQFNY